MISTAKISKSCCKNCNNIFDKRFDSNRVYCSSLCRAEYRNKNKKKKIKPTKICPKCNSEHTKDGLFCSRSCANSRIRSDEFKKKASEYAQQNPKGWALYHALNLDTHWTKLGGLANKEKWSKLRKTLTCNECQKEFEVPHSQRNRKYCSVNCSNKNKYHENSNRKKTCIYKGYRMDSGAELVFAQQCDLLNIQWRKNTTEYFFFTNANGKLAKYYPDFYLKQYDMWVEIKGERYMRSDDDIRRAAVGKPVFLIISNRFKLDFEKFKEFIGSR